MAMRRNNSGRIDGISPYRGPSGGDPEDYLNSEVSPFHASPAPSASGVASQSAPRSLPTSLPTSSAPVSTPSGVPAPVSSAPPASPGYSGVSPAPTTSAAAPRGGGGVSLGPLTIGPHAPKPAPIGPQAGWGYGLDGGVQTFNGNVNGGPGQFNDDPLGEFGPNVGSLGGPIGAVLGPSSLPSTDSGTPAATGDATVDMLNGMDLTPAPTGPGSGTPSSPSSPHPPPPSSPASGPYVGTGLFGGGSNYQMNNDPFYVGEAAGPDVIGSYYAFSNHPVHALTEGELRLGQAHAQEHQDNLDDGGGGGGGFGPSSTGAGIGTSGYEDASGRHTSTPTHLAANTPGWTSSSGGHSIAPHRLPNTHLPSPGSGPFSPSSGDDLGLLPSLVAMLRQRHPRAFSLQSLGLKP